MATSYTIILDCGSTSTRAHIYATHESDGRTSVVKDGSTEEDALSLMVEPGLATMAPSDVDAYIKPLLFDIQASVPPAAHRQTRLRALATGGMRLRSSAQQQLIWRAVRTAVRTHTVFEHREADAMTLSGNFEAAFYWLALTRAIDQSAAIGGLDLGGASLQIAFSMPHPSDAILADAYRLTRNGSTSRLYAHSYMNYGQDAATSRRYALIVSDHSNGLDAPPTASTRLPDPCLHRGYNVSVSTSSLYTFYGVGDWSACARYAQRLVHNDYECTLPPCGAMGVYQPPINNVRFIAGSGFFYTVRGLGLLSGSDGSWQGSFSQIAKAGRAYCSRQWSDVHADVGRYAANYCWASAWVPTLLASLNFDAEQTSITYAHQLNGADISWALGAQIYYDAEQRCELASAAASSSSYSGATASNLLSLEGAARGSESVLFVLGWPAALALGCFLGSRMRPAWAWRRAYDSVEGARV